MAKNTLNYVRTEYGDWYEPPIEFYQCNGCGVVTDEVDNQGFCPDCEPEEEDEDEE